MSSSTGQNESVSRTTLWKYTNYRISQESGGKFGKIWYNIEQIYRSSITNGEWR